MIFEADINGISVKAHYSERSVREIFVPLLKRLDAMQKEKGRRILVLLAAPPGAGKSTLLKFLQYLCETMERMPQIQIIGMDGFHRYQEYLQTHTLMRDGKEISMVDVKGCPETFDLELLTEAVRKVAAGEIVGWPEYDRMLHNPVEKAVTVEGDIVLLEGNYLLLDRPGWRDLSQFADYTIRIDAELADLKERLINRKAASSAADRKAAVEFVEFSDLYNARLCLGSSMEGDLNLRLSADDEYVML